MPLSPIIPALIVGTVAVAAVALSKDKPASGNGQGSGDLKKSPPMPKPQGNGAPARPRPRRPTDPASPQEVTELAGKLAQLGAGAVGALNAALDRRAGRNRGRRNGQYSPGQPIPSTPIPVEPRPTGPNGNGGIGNGAQPIPVPSTPDHPEHVPGVTVGLDCVSENTPPTVAPVIKAAFDSQNPWVMLTVADVCKKYNLWDEATCLEGAVSMLTGRPASDFQSCIDPNMSPNIALAIGAAAVTLDKAQIEQAANYLAPMFPASAACLGQIGESLP